MLNGLDNDIDQYASGRLGFGTFNPGAPTESYGQQFDNFSSVGIPGCGEAQAMPAVISMQILPYQLINPPSHFQAGDVVTVRLGSDLVTFICAGYVPIPARQDADIYIPMAVSGVIETNCDDILPTDDNMYCRSRYVEGNAAEANDFDRILGKLLMPNDLKRPQPPQTTLVFVTGPISWTDIGEIEA